MRRLRILISAIVLLDVAFFAAIAPLLPDYVDRFGLSEAGAGVLAASYAVGTLVASLPAGLVATRFGPRRTVIWGLVVLGVSSLVFGFGQDIVLLDVARFVQGVAGALIWAGGLSWLILSAPPERRGAVIGTALGAAVAGALLGPALGAVAAAIGTEVVFGAVLGISLMFAALAAPLPEPARTEHQPLRAALTAIGSRPILIATAFVIAPSLMIGVIEVLVPLRIDELGGGHLAIAAGFIAGALLEASLTPLAGAYSDRVGRRRPYVVGTVICAVAMALLAVGTALGPVLAVLLVAAVGSGFCFAPGTTALSEAADLRNLHQGFAAALSNFAWASGQAIGALAAGAAANAAGIAAPSLAVAALLLFAAATGSRWLKNASLPAPG